MRQKEEFQKLGNGLINQFNNSINTPDIIEN